jgi:hypothetical protein
MTWSKAAKKSNSRFTKVKAKPAGSDSGGLLLYYVYKSLAESSRAEYTATEAN